MPSATQWIRMKCVHQVSKMSGRLVCPCSRLWLKTHVGNSLVVQWLRRRASTARCVGLIPGQGTKTLHNMHNQKKRKEFFFKFGFLFIFVCLLVENFKILGLIPHSVLM